MSNVAIIQDEVTVVALRENQAIIVVPQREIVPIVVNNDSAAVVVSPSSQVIPVVVESGGPSGPPGEGEVGGGDLHFKFTQSLPSSKWTIKHNLGKFPSVFVQDSANDEIEGDVEYLNPNELIITFSASFSGLAYLN